MSIVAYKFEGKIYDVHSVGELKSSATPIEFDNESDSLDVLRHSCAHLLAHAISEMYPDSQFFVGPVVDEGFYYDMRISSKISETDLESIEKKMKDIAKRGDKIEKYDISMQEARIKFKDDDLKQNLLTKINMDSVSIYKQGKFEDLCRGPHINSVGMLKHFKLTKLAGAYLDGEGSEMLVRIYGIAFATKEALDQYIFQQEEAKKRDHRKLANEMQLFMFDDDVGAGLPIWLPSGARIRRNMEALLHTAHIRRNYEPVRGPEILKSNMWKISGHYENYKENMYFTCIDEQEYGIKPMNCLGHIKVFSSTTRSYRDLPLRFYEYGLVHRHEKSGVLHGLLRVREFTQDDAHLFCMPSQVRQEVFDIIEFVDSIMKTFNFEYEMELSTRPAKSIGSDEVWESATKALRDALEERKIKYQVDEGGGAFYGPKIDIKITDAIGRKWQCGTVQIDMNLPERFDIGYISEDNTKERPVMIHRAILGSFERFIAILTEHCAGEFPFFIAPTQVVIIPIEESHNQYANELLLKLREVGAYSEILDKNDSLSKRVRVAEKSRVPMIVIIGDKEASEKILSIRDRREKIQYNIDEKDFILSVKGKMSEAQF